MTLHLFCDCKVAATFSAVLSANADSVRVGFAVPPSEMFHFRPNTGADCKDALLSELALVFPDDAVDFASIELRAHLSLH
jgi:hypothetical protein